VSWRRGHRGCWSGRAGPRGRARGTRGGEGRISHVAESAGCDTQDSPNTSWMRPRTRAYMTRRARRSSQYNARAGRSDTAWGHDRARPEVRCADRTRALSSYFPRGLASPRRYSRRRCPFTSTGGRAVLPGLSIDAADCTDPTPAWHRGDADRPASSAPHPHGDASRSTDRSRARSAIGPAPARPVTQGGGARRTPATLA